jgi:subtilisin-like proprotein convertase family protein
VDQYESLVMSRRGWQAALVWSAILVPLALGVSCAANDETDDLFLKSSSPSAGGFDPNSLGDAGNGGGERNGSSGAGGTKTPPKASGGRVSASGGNAAGGSDSTGGRASVSGGRASGGKGGGQVGGRPAMGGAPSGGKPAAGGSSGGTSSGGSPATGGGAGESSEDCDDGDACTVDESAESGCVHEPKVCPEPAVCEVATCEPETGDCVPAAAPDEVACDDGDACTSDDVCRDGQCVGSNELNASDETSRPIPDGTEGCDGTDAVLVNYAMTGPGEVSEVEVTVALSHVSITDLRLALLQVETETFVILMQEELQQGAALDGEYVFADGEASFAEAVSEDAVVPPGRYAPRSSFHDAFGGLPIEGTWRVVVLDQCIGETGVLHSSAVHFHQACAED